MLPLQIFFASAGIVLTTYIGYVIIKSWINRWKQHNTSKSLASKENLPQPPSVSISLDQGKDLGLIVNHFPQNNLKNANPLTAKTDPEPEKQQKPIDEFNKLVQKLDEDIAELQDAQQGISLGLEECQTIHESNKRLFEEVKAKITEANSSPSP